MSQIKNSHASPLARNWKEELLAVGKNRTDGALTLALRTAEILSEPTLTQADPFVLSRLLRTVQKQQGAMAPLFRFLSECISILPDSIEILPSIAIRRAADFRQSKTLHTKIVLERADLYHGRRIALFSSSSTVTSGLQILADHGQGPLNMTIAHSLPGGEGRALAEDFSNRGFTVHSVPDTAFFQMIHERSFDLLILGCDAVDSRYFINKIGSGPVAALALQSGIQVEVWTTTHKFLSPSGLDAVWTAIQSKRHLSRLFGRGNVKDVSTWVTEEGPSSTAELGNHFLSL